MFGADSSGRTADPDKVCVGSSSLPRTMSHARSSTGRVGCSLTGEGSSPFEYETHGPLAHLGERLPCKQGVAGAEPAGSKYWAKYSVAGPSR